MTMTDTSTIKYADRGYASTEADEATKLVYRVGNEPLPLSRNPHLAACDVMILTYAAQRHAKWLRSIGACPAGVADQIRRHLAVIEEVIAASEASPPQTNDVGARATTVQSGGDAAPVGKNATRRNTGERVESASSLFNKDAHASSEARAEGQQESPSKMYPRLAQTHEAGD